MNGGAPQRNSNDSPWHEGEAAVQTRVGVRDRLEHIGRHVIRDRMPDEHREFFEQLPMVVVGSLDAASRPWASLLTGWPGFIESPDARTLRVAAEPAFGDPLRANLEVNARVALLGIELATRRRNRANGAVTAVGHGDFEMRVEQSFGNCPQYIQARTPSFVADPRAPTANSRPPLTEVPVLSARAAALIAGADTFFIATAAANARGGDARHGSDVSHRGGNSGFVRVEREQNASVLYWPEFRGNFFFNTLGNIEANPLAGLLFVDFTSGWTLLLTGTAGVIWDGPAVAAFAGAERLVRFAPAAGVWVEAGAALRWSAPTFARQLAATGPARAHPPP